MVFVAKYLAPEAVIDGLSALDKRGLLFELAKKVAHTSGVNIHEVYERLIEREKLGSTAIGHGLAIPHIRTRQTTQIQGFFFRLRQPVAFDAPDGQPVDLVFLLMTPELAGADHLQALSRISRLLKEPRFAETLRYCEGGADGLHLLLTQQETERLAA